LKPLFVFVLATALLPAQVLRYAQWEPRVIDQNQSSPVTLTVRVDGPARVEFVPSTGPVVSLTPVSGVYRATLQPQQVLLGYQTGDNHSFAGFLDVYDGATRVIRANLTVNVRDAGVPDVDIKNVNPDVQLSRHVVNLSDDNLYFAAGTPFPPAVVQRIYQFLGDDFDFVGIVGQVSAFSNRAYVGVRNAINGIGLGPQDAGASYGSARRLLGVIQFPLDGFFDWAETGAIHEIGHRWCCYLNQAALTPGRPHWPLSDLAYGILGYSDPVNSQGLAFPYTLADQGGGNYRLQPAARAREFNLLELYLMGLAVPAEVPAAIVFQNQNQQVPGAGVLQGPVTTVRIDDVIGRDGARTPTIQNHFRVATIVLSAGRLLSREEMAFYDLMAARGEESRELTERSGIAPRGTTKPFYLATRQRASLSAMVCDTCAVFGAQPRFTAASVVNAASFSPGPIAPGEIITIFGSAMGPRDLVTLGVGAAGLVEKLLGETRVLFDDVPAAMVYTRADQLSCVVPYAVAGKARVNVVVEYQGRKSNAVNVQVAPTSPAFFSLDQSGRGPGAFLNQDNSVNGPANPAARGSVVILYATGEGVTTPLPADGAILTAEPLPHPVAPLSVRIGAADAQVLYKGAAPGFVAGAMQLNVRVPDSAPPGAVGVILEVGGVASAPGITLAVR
jgi:uncharacterized protein (TIGR03437 family)